ncbi:MAG: FtsX-like permease family protein [Gemmatimonadales bacterium]
MEPLWRDLRYAARSLRREPVFALAQRTGEIGIRMALGASVSNMRRMIVRRGMGVAGLGLGLLGALAAGRFIAAFLYGVSPGDPAILLAILLLFAAVALLVSWLPARRAARLDPVRALRAE